MRQLRPVDLVVDIDIPSSGFYSDETMDGPGWGTLQMSRTFFGRDGWEWIRTQVELNHLYLDGERLTIPRRISNDYRHWRLIDVERFAHALATNGFLSVEQLVRVLDQIRIIAESWGYLPPKPIPIRAAEHDPNRKDIYAVVQQEEATDDLDGSKGARERRWSLGDVDYAADFTDEHWNDLVAAMAPYVKVARRSTGRTDDPTTRGDRTKIRNWAKKNGYPVGERGRIPQATMDAYLRRT